MLQSIRGVIYRILFKKNIGKHEGLPSNAIGACDSPKIDNPEIWIERNLDWPEEMRVVLHEILHAGQWSMSEKAVHEVSLAQAEALRRLGYHK